MAGIIGIPYLTHNPHAKKNISPVFVYIKTIET